MKKVIFEKYKTLNDLLSTIEERPLNSVFKGQSLKSVDTSSEYKGFSGTSSYSDAMDLMLTGFSDPLEEMKREIVKIDKMSSTTKQKEFLNVVGRVAHVPNAIIGIPLSMIDKERRKETTKTIHLLYGFSALGSAKPKDLIKGGTNFIGLVNSLEKQGFRVKIDIVRCTTTESTAIGYICNVKEYSQKLNLLKLCFPLVHPSMLRRISFKWCETIPELEDNGFRHGYGASLIARLDFDMEKEKEFLKDAGILNDPNKYYCNVYTAMACKDINMLAEKMGLK